MENKNEKLGSNFQNRCLILFSSSFSRTIKLKKNDSEDGSIDRKKGKVNSLHSPRPDICSFTVN